MRVGSAQDQMANVFVEVGAMRCGVGKAANALFTTLAKRPWLSGL
jgi:hypothetical protein